MHVYVILKTFFRFKSFFFVLRFWKSTPVSYTIPSYNILILGPDS